LHLNFGALVIKLHLKCLNLTLSFFFLSKSGGNFLLNGLFLLIEFINFLFEFLNNGFILLVFGLKFANGFLEFLIDLFGMLILLDYNGVLLFGVFERLEFETESFNLLFECKMFTGKMSGFIDFSFEVKVKLLLDF
jgi:hypothetical protein